MIDPIFLELSKYGGGTALIVALVFLVREIGRVWKSKNGGQEITELKKKVNNEYFHIINSIQQDVRDIRNDIQNLQQRVSKIEAHLDK